MFSMGICRENFPEGVAVVDKINIFRPDRVFMVISLFLSYMIPFSFLMCKFTCSFVQLCYLLAGICYRVHGQAFSSVYAVQS